MPLELYTSSNGDRWELVRDATTGLPNIAHAPNRSSGGAPSLISVRQFLSAEHYGPEQDALLSLLADLADEPQELRGGPLGL